MGNCPVAGQNDGVCLIDFDIIDEIDLSHKMNRAPIMLRANLTNDSFTRKERLPRYQLLRFLGL